MSYYIKQQLISMNRPKEKFINLKGITIHSTANIGGTSLNHFNYWNNADRQSSVHFIADWIGEEIYQFIPENEIAWHTGSWQGNREWLGIEMCETAVKNQFEIVWNKTVWFVADLYIRKDQHGLSPYIMILIHYVTKHYHQHSNCVIHKSATNQTVLFHTISN